MSTTLILFFSIMLFIVTLCLGGCIESERNALLQFKSSLSDPSDRLSHWDVVYGSDCCRWTGVVCHNITFHVFELHLRREHYVRSYDQDYNEYEEYYRNSAIGGKVNSSLLELKHLSYLDLSNNDFGGSRIPQFIGSMQSLRYLNLSKAGFGGVIPPQLGNLSNLQYLNLHASYIDNLSFGNYRLNVENLDWVLSLSSLEFLDMSGVNLSRSFDWLKVISTLSCLIELHLPDCRLPVYNPTRLPCVNMSSSLLVLDLSYNHLGGPIPNVLQNVTSSFLRELDLSYNNFNSSIPNWFYDLTNLQLLKLRVNDLQGKISRDIGNLTSLISLDMSFNRELEFEKGIPKSFKRFCNLRYLDLSTIKINQDINDILAILSRCISNVLQWLDLSDCQLSGHLTDDLAYFKNLSTFRIPRNVISGSIPLSFGELKSLVMLDIQNNILNGSLPVSFGNLKELEYVDISDNELEGEVSHLHFENLTRLNLFRASDNNNISLRVSSNWIPPLQLQYLGLRSWLIGSQFPSWLCLLKHLTFLDLSNSSISTSVPIAFWDSISSYYYLNFSHNRIYGSVPDIPFLNAYQPVIDLSSNNFSGAVPYFSSNVTALDLSNNSFSGSIFNFLCYKMNEEKQMQVLNLARNLLHGEIPDCWRSWKNLGAVKFSNNKFGGNIPSSIGNLSLLESLNLRNNNLSGEIPWQIQNCKYLFTLDFSENNFVGKFPTWIGDRFGDLRILSLSANKFDGYLPMGLCGLVSLHILNLAHNSFSGMIPSCFSNFVGMATRNDSSGTFYAARGTFMESTILVMKGKVMEYSTNLRFVRSIDLSDNNLSGEIPTEVTRIAGLLSLNLSQNDLTGRIPNNIGDMKGLESIDLSHNQLSGEIPESISTLTFLSTLDFSYNNLFGRIPSSTQLQSFDSSSFVGNQLCGLPLTNNCTSVNAWPEIEEKDENEDEVDVLFYVSMAFGFVFGFWSVVGSLIFIRKWRHFYFHFVYYLGEKIW